MMSWMMSGNIQHDLKSWSTKTRLHQHRDILPGKQSLAKLLVPFLSTNHSSITTLQLNDEWQHDNQQGMQKTNPQLLRALSCCQIVHIILWSSKECRRIHWHLRDRPSSKKQWSMSINRDHDQCATFTSVVFDANQHQLTWGKPPRHPVFGWWEVETGDAKERPMTSAKAFHKLSMALSALAALPASRTAWKIWLVQRLNE